MWWGAAPWRYPGPRPAPRLTCSAFDRAPRSPAPSTNSLSKMSTESLGSGSLGSGSSGAPRESVDPSPACQVGGRARWGAQPRGDARDGVGVGGERGGGARVGNARRGWRGLEDGAETRLVLWGVARGHASGEAQEEAGRGGRGLAARTRRRMKLECFCSSRALVRARTRLGLPCAQQRHGSAPRARGRVGRGRGWAKLTGVRWACAHTNGRERETSPVMRGVQEERRRGKRRRRRVANRPSST